MARLYQLEVWDTTPQRGLALDTVYDGLTTDDDALGGLQEFALIAEALLLFYTMGMSRVDFEFLPDETYTFPWARL